MFHRTRNLRIKTRPLEKLISHADSPGHDTYSRFIAEKMTEELARFQQELLASPGKRNSGNEVAQPTSMHLPILAGIVRKSELQLW